MSAPTIGRIVLIQHFPPSIPASPAIVTAMHSPNVINCRCFQDNPSSPQWYNSVPKDRDLGPSEIKPVMTWLWPPGSREALAEASEPETANAPTEPETEARTEAEQAPSEAPIG